MNVDACNSFLLNGEGGVCILPENERRADGRGSRLMRTFDKTRLKRTLTAVLLVFVLSLSAAFAEGGEAGTQQAEVQAGAETSAVTEPQPEVPGSRIIKKGKNYYYKNPV